MTSNNLSYRCTAAEQRFCADGEFPEKVDIFLEAHSKMDNFSVRRNLSRNFASTYIMRNYIIYCVSHNMLHRYHREGKTAICAAC